MNDQREGRRACCLAKSPHAFRAQAVASSRLAEEGDPTRQAFFRSEQTSQLPPLLAKDSMNSLSWAAGASNSRTTLSWRSSSPSPNASPRQLKMNPSLSPRISSREAIFRQTSFTPLRTASTLSSSTKSGVSVKKVAQEVVRWGCPPSKRTLVSLKVSKTQSLTTSLRSSRECSMSYALMHLTPWQRLILADSFRKSQDIFASSSCLRESADQSQLLGMKTRGTSVGCRLFLSSWKVSLQMVTRCPYLTSWRAVRKPTTPAPTTAHSNISLLSALRLSIMPASSATANPITLSSTPRPQLWKMCLLPMDSCSRRMPPRLVCEETIFDDLRLDLAIKGNLTFPYSICVTMMELLISLVATAHLYGRMNLFFQDLPNRSNSLSIGGGLQNLKELSSGRGSIPALDCDIPLPRLAEFIIVGHELVLVVIDLERLDLLQVQAGTGLFALGGCFHAEGQRLLILFGEEFFLLVLQAHHF